VVEAHLLALRQAVEPWRWSRWVYERDQAPGQLVTFLGSAGIDDIREACRRQDFTHVHVLAHGRPLGDGSDGRFGLWLHRGVGREVVSGQRLAQALCVANTDERRSDPLVVTLAACDTARLPSPIVPGGSMAHDLHENGVPWVIASQLPLTASGSVIFARDVYDGLLRARDPRVVLSDLRGHLASRFGDRHDWAAVVAYASLPHDFEPSLQRYRLRAARAVRDHAYTLVDLLLLERWRGGPRPTRRALEQAAAAAKAALEAFENAHDVNRSDRLDRPELVPSATLADHYATSAALRKRQAEVNWLRAESGREWRRDLALALGDYITGVSLGSYDAHWNLAQTSVLTAVLRRFPPAGRSAADWRDAYFEEAVSAAQLATRQPEPTTNMWGWSTLAELYLVRSATEPGGAPAETLKALERMLSFNVPARVLAVWTTFRQFQRFRHWWNHDDWRATAQAACDFLRPHALPEPATSAPTPASD
jgi:hypothetical protein